MSRKILAPGYYAAIPKAHLKGAPLGYYGPSTLDSAVRFAALGARDSKRRIDVLRGEHGAPAVVVAVAVPELCDRAGFGEAS